MVVEVSHKLHSGNCALSSTAKIDEVVRWWHSFTSLFPSKFLLAPAWQPLGTSSPAPILRARFSWTHCRDFTFLQRQSSVLPQPRAELCAGDALSTGNKWVLASPSLSSNLLSCGREDVAQPVCIMFSLQCPFVSRVVNSILFISAACCRGETSHSNSAWQDPEKEIRTAQCKWLGLWDCLTVRFYVCVKMLTGFISHEGLASCPANNSKHSHNHDKMTPVQVNAFGVPHSSKLSLHPLSSVHGT